MTSVNPSMEELVITEEPKKSIDPEKKDMVIGLGELQVTDKIVIQQMKSFQQIYLLFNCSN